MIRIFKVGFIFIMSLMIFSCNKNDATVAEFPIVPYAEQYAKDNTAIETYLKTHSIIVTDHAGFSDDQDVAFATVTAGDASSIWGSDPLNPKLSLLSKTVLSNEVSYKVYYLKLREGIGQNPTRVDSTFVSYKGQTLADATFDQAPNPIWLRLSDVISGWREIFPLFKTGTSGIAIGDGTVRYDDFGAGVMFLPSGLAYYNGSSGSIPAYSPLIFSFKLKALNYVDHDRDRIDSKDEDINNDGDPTNDDTDGDGIANFLDIDDDADGYTTKSEIKKPTPFLGTSFYYPFNPIADDPATTTINESEPKGIPNAAGDGVTTTRTRRHLDKNSHPPFTTY